MKHLDTAQRAYVIRCFASRLDIPTTVGFFTRVFPYFGRHMGEETLKNRLTERFKKIKQKYADEILQLRQKDPNAYWFLPFSYPHVRIREFLKIYEETPTLERTRRGYKCNANLKLRILKQIHKEAENLKNDMPEGLYEQLMRCFAESARE